MEDLYCKLFVAGDTDRERLAALLATELGGMADDKNVRTEALEAEIRNNEDFDPARCEDPEQGFLFFPLYLEIEPVALVARDSYVCEVSTIVAALRRAGRRVVPACDFEEELP